MVFQDYALWPHLMAHDNVAFALRRRQLPRARGREQADAMLDRVGLAAQVGRYPNELSGGEQQRVALARALVADTGPHPLRRAALQPRRGPAGADAGGDLLAGPRGRGHHRLHHPRPGRGVRAGRPGRRARTRAWSSSAPRRRSTPSPRPRSWPASPGWPANSPSASGETARERHVRGGSWPAGRAGPAVPRPAAAGPAAPARPPALLLIRPTGVQLCAGHRRAPPHRDRRGRRVPRPRLRARHRHPGHGRLTGVFAADPGGPRRDWSGCASTRRLPRVRPAGAPAGPAPASRSPRRPAARRRAAPATAVPPPAPPRAPTLRDADRPAGQALASEP